MKFLRVVGSLLAIFCFVFLSRIEAVPDACKYAHAIDAYNAADVVVIGKAVGKAANGFDLRFQIMRHIKGQSNSEILLRGQKPETTEQIGFSLTENTELLLLLHKNQDGLYDAVETYNGGCPAVFYFVVDGKVVLEEGNRWFPEQDKSKIEVPLDTILNYFHQSPSAGN